MEDTKEYTESEKREIQLEATIHAMYEVIDQFSTILPNPLSQYVDALYNQAEIRSNIEELVQINIETE